MNTLSVSGNLANLKTRETNSGTLMVTFGVADRQYQNGEEKTQWWNCTAFGKRAETLAKFKDKLSKITVNGKVVQNTHDGKVLFNVLVNDYDLTFKAGADSVEKTTEVATDEIPF